VEDSNNPADKLPEVTAEILSQFPTTISMQGFDFIDARGFDEPQCFLADSLNAVLCMRVKFNLAS
jgi:hypothetical protein